jgi:hypothetical protein
METKYTKGNWKVKRSDSINNYTGYNYQLITDREEIPLEEANANVRLIEAAPDLLTALDELIDVLNEQLTEDALENESIIEAMDLAEKALKKAKGE